MSIKLTDQWKSVCGCVAEAKNKLTSFYHDDISNVVLLTLGGAAFAFGTAGMLSGLMFAGAAVYQFCCEHYDKALAKRDQQAQGPNDDSTTNNHQPSLKEVIIADQTLPSWSLIFSSGSAFVENLVDVAIGAPEKRAEKAIMMFAWLAGCMGDNRIRVNHVKDLKQKETYRLTIMDQIGQNIKSALPQNLFGKTAPKNNEGNDKGSDGAISDKKEISGVFNHIVNIGKQAIKTPNILFGLTSIGMSLSMISSPDVGIAQKVIYLVAIFSALGGQAAFIHDMVRKEAVADDVCDTDDGENASITPKNRLLDNVALWDKFGVGAAVFQGLAGALSGNFYMAVGNAFGGLAVLKTAQVHHAVHMNDGQGSGKPQAEM